MEGEKNRLGEKTNFRFRASPEVKFHADSKFPVLGKSNGLVCRALFSKSHRQPWFKFGASHMDGPAPHQGDP